jgi:hypothetical protein
VHLNNVNINSALVGHKKGNRQGPAVDCIAVAHQFYTWGCRCAKAGVAATNKTPTTSWALRPHRS